MALINFSSIEKKEKQLREQEYVKATYTINNLDDDVLFQIDTYGNADRANPDKVSQSLTFDKKNLLSFLELLRREVPDVFTKRTLESFDVPLFDNEGKLQYCFRWGFGPDGNTLRDSARTGNEAYIALPPRIYKSDFYPSNPQTFVIKTDDEKSFIFKRAQKDEKGQALETTDDNGQEGNKELGKYIRSRLGIESGAPITKEAVTKYGNDKITLSKDENGNYFLSFKPGFKFEKEPLILYGPPGTGKTFKMQHEYIDKFSKDDCFITTFHQSFSYEEFVEGLKPVLSDEGIPGNVEYQIEPGIFYQACEQAALLAGYTSLDECLEDSESNRRQKIKEAVDNKKVVLLCIDEINRANVSSVFGDLISLVESSKRLGAEYEMIAKLPYSKKDFGVPANLMIVGTMNTADRSIQLLDSALRRRFKFEELLPDYSAITNNNAKKILQNINNRIRALLDKDHQIGHSYFIGKNTDLEILNVMKQNIIPLLEEYFYNETDKIRVVLNEMDDLLIEENAKKHEANYFYVIDKEATDSVKNTSDFDDEKIIYRLNDNLYKIANDDGANVYLEHLIKESKSNSEQGE